MKSHKQITEHPELLGMPEVRKLWLTEELFSDHYLKARIKKNTWWPTDEQAEDQPSLPIETVDYADLRVQQLGSVYEGLLEHHFARNEDGRLKLVTDKAERKATGTYYTSISLLHD